MFAIIKKDASSIPFSDIKEGELFVASIDGGVGGYCFTKHIVFSVQPNENTNAITPDTEERCWFSPDYPVYKHNDIMGYIK